MVIFAVEINWVTLGWNMVRAGRERRGRAGKAGAEGRFRQSRLLCHRPVPACMFAAVAPVIRACDGIRQLKAASVLHQNSVFRILVGAV